MKLRLLFFFLVIFSVNIQASVCWPGLFKVNQYNKNGLRHGRWVYYWDGTKVPMNRLRFKNGREFGMNRYYNEKGKKWLQFNAFKDGRMKVTYYDEYGRKEKKGDAIMIYDPGEIRYSWNGKWKFYENGKVIKTVIYEMGAPIEEEAKEDRLE